MAAITSCGSKRSSLQCEAATATLLAATAFFIALISSAASSKSQESGWQPETRITENEAVSSAPPNNCKYLAIDLENNVHIVWLDDRDRNFEIYHRAKVGEIWLPEERLTFSAGTSARPNLALDASGLLHLVWNDDTEGNMEIYHRYLIGGAWSRETRVTYTSGESFASSITAVADTLHLVYTETLDSLTQIAYRAFRNFAWSNAVYLTNEKSGKRLVPSIDSGPDGSLHVAWWDSRADSQSSNGKIFYRCMSAGCWLEEELVSDPTRNAMRPSIAVDDSGYVHVAWIDASGSYEQIHYRRRTRSGWEPEIALTSGSSTHYHPSIDAFGNVAVLAYWDNSISEFNSEVFSMRRKNGIWNAPERVSHGNGSSDLCCLLSQRNGNLHIAWVDMRDGNREIYYREYIDPASGIEDGKERPPDSNPRFSVSVSPNPSQLGTRLAISLAAQSETSVYIYSADGRRVRKLVSEHLSGGTHFFEWDGSSDYGKRVAPGLYLVSVRADKMRETKKILLLP